MMSLVMIVLFALLVGRVAGAALGAGPRSHLHRRHRARLRNRSEAEAPVPPLPPLPAPRPAETPVEKLQRQFSEGAISVEQYERELNRLYGIRG